MQKLLLELRTRVSAFSTLTIKARHVPKQVSALTTRACQARAIEYAETGLGFKVRTNLAAEKPE